MKDARQVLCVKGSRMRRILRLQKDAPGKIAFDIVYGVLIAPAASLG